MATYTIGFLHPTDQSPEHVYFNAVSLRHVHMMFMGELANVWGFGWHDVQFSDETDLAEPVGCIMLEGKPLHYEIIQGYQEPGGELAMLA
jgi:hypothetical protein